MDEHGTPYYMHAPSGRSQWEPPASVEDADAASRRMEDHMLQQGIEMPLSTSMHLPPGDMFTELAAAGRRLDSLRHTRKKRLNSMTAEQLPSVQDLDLDTAAVQMQKAAEEAQAQARVHRASAQEHFSPEEVQALLSHVNEKLKDDPDVGNLLPFTSDTQLARAAAGSLILAKYLAAVDPESLDLRALNRPKMSSDAANPPPVCSSEVAYAAGTPVPTITTIPVAAHEGVGVAGQEHRGALAPEQRMQNHTLVVNALTATGCGLPHLQPEQLEEAADNKEVLHELLWKVATYDLLTPLTPKARDTPRPRHVLRHGP